MDYFWICLQYTTISFRFRKTYVTKMLPTVNIPQKRVHWIKSKEAIHSDTAETSNLYFTFFISLAENVKVVRL